MTYKSKPERKFVKKAKRSLEDILRSLSNATFARMVMKSGLSGEEGRELNDAFKDLK